MKSEIVLLTEVCLRAHRRMSTYCNNDRKRVQLQDEADVLLSCVALVLCYVPASTTSFLEVVPERDLVRSMYTL
jgi:hypothetical protein